MIVFLGFILFSVFYAIGMSLLGRHLRERGHGKTLEKVAGLHARITHAKAGVMAKVAHSIWRK